MPTGVMPFDAMTRHQLMLERVKGFYYLEFNKTLKKVERELRSALAATGKDSLDALTRRQLAALQADFSRRQAPVWAEWRDTLLTAAKALARVDRRLAAAIIEAIQPDTERALSARQILTRSPDFDTLWASILSEPIGANGQTLEAMLQSFTDSASVRLSNKLAFGYANNETNAETLNGIVGAKGTNTGEFRTLRTQSRAVIATGLQHVSAESQAAVQGGSYNTYRWVSVLDDRTTDICRHRNGKIFEHGKGPKPPAHFHCRSTIVPAITGSTPQEDKNNADEWLADQLAETVVGMLGTRLHNTREAIATVHTRPLTINDFGNSADIMTRKR